MRQAEIVTGKVEMLVVDLPLEATEWGISTNGWFTWCNDNYDKENSDIEFEGFKEGLEQVPVGNWQRLGKATELTEEDWKGIVDQSIHTQLFAHYAEGVTPPNVYAYKNSTESALSLLKANGVDLSIWKNAHVFIKQK